ncbi:EAL and HDOD domain-containing protein [Trinickia soli]|mgnify:CR=1 FL=1|uniref:Diguanylate phosphodiesterase n=1 Tax=Trinickia soli TaxID=380675 RepID=A0A2N7W5D2_9BURK|nr:EAL domain-containing protein [Trinickia soli]KAA0090499.1 EAL domain-containing protein [Paraburkholderia sp. T12-10]PMS24608.1 diguanylate phosphodiesterase [Trinickia soli]CAB3650890.1 Cyclic di-GMP phosphodiesterase CdgJ [Trinickia soli]
MAESATVRTHASPFCEARAACEVECLYLGRQPILTRDGALEAYELLFRGSNANRALIDHDARATARVVANAMCSIGVAATLGTRRGYVNVCREMLLDDMVMLLPPERFVLEVLETVTVDALLLERIDKLRRAGFRIALDDICELSDELVALLPHIDIVKIDFLHVDRERLPTLAAAVQEHGRTLVAEKIETQDDYALAHGLGFDLFQGYFFARPQVLSVRRGDPSRESLLRMLALIASEAPLIELETELKRSPAVVMQLLQLANSSAFGFGRRIASVREAILAAGTRQIARWAQLLLYASSGDLSWRRDPLAQLAGARSRFMELAASRVRPTDERFVDAAFMTGVFSLVHVLLGDAVPGEALVQVGLVAEIGDAIVHRVGLLGAILAIAEAAEAGVADEAARAARHAHPELEALTPAAVAEINLEAATWGRAHDPA